MFRIIRDPPSAFIGETEVRLLYYSENLESRIEAPLSALRGVRVDQYPAMLDCTLILNDLHIQDELEICYLYRSYPSEDIRLCFSFGSPQGIWKNDVAIGAAMKELLTLPEISEIRKNFQVDHDNEDIFFTRILDKSSPLDLHEELIDALSDLRDIVAKINARLFGFRWRAEYETDEALFTKQVVIPLLRKMGFEAVRYNHGVSEYGRDVLFADLDKFSRVRHYAAQVKAGGINASNGTLLNQLIVQIDDSFAMAVRGPGKSKQFHISEVYIICSGKISDGAVERLNQKLDPRLSGSVHFLDIEDILHLAQVYLGRN